MRKYIPVTLGSFLVLIILTVWSLYAFTTGTFRIVFCDVGQGDAIFLRTPSGMDILIDGGPDERVLSCLSDHMPFWDRTIEIMILSHPHADHLIGLISVIKRYDVATILTEDLINVTDTFSAFEKAATDEKSKRRTLFARDRFTIDSVAVETLGPSKEFLERTSPGGIVGEKNEFASLVLGISYKDFSLLLTGDSQAEGIQDALETSTRSRFDILHVPHHGSKTGLTRKLVSHVSAKLAVISVGKNNRYHHPSPQILKLLDQLGVAVKRTDRDGAIEIETNGRVFWVD